MNVKFIIAVPFLKGFDPVCGSSIRIAAYTNSLNELKIDYKFLSAIKPDYVPDNNYEPLAMSRKWTKVILIHNLLFSKTWSSPFSYLVRFILENFAGIKKISRKVENRIIWAHQENTLATYLFFVHGKNFIYDVHGFFDIQREYRHGLNLWRKLWFDLYLKNEKTVLRIAPYINVVSSRMKEYVEKTFQVNGEIILAPDGIPAPIDEYLLSAPNYKFRAENNLSEDEKIILFAGSFKKIGGALELVKVFLRDEKINSKAVLLLIGEGQEEEEIKTLVSKSYCSERVYHLRPMIHNKLISFLKIANTIVCPDIAGNYYNEMTPHIKIFDAIASGRNVVATDFEVNKELFDPGKFNVFYFSYDKIDSFNAALDASLENNEQKNTRIHLENLTYAFQAKSYILNFINNK